MWGQDGGDGERHFNILCRWPWDHSRRSKKRLLLHCTEMEVHDIFKSLKDTGTPERKEDNVYKAALRTLDAYFTPQA